MLREGAVVLGGGVLVDRRIKPAFSGSFPRPNWSTMPESTTSQVDPFVSSSSDAHSHTQPTGTSGGPFETSNRLPDGNYEIENVFTGAYIALLDGNDQSEVVNVTNGLTNDQSRGLKVILSPRNDQ